MAKTRIIDQNSERNILQERLFLSKMNNPFLVNMLCSFQDRDNLYLVLQLLTGGDLRYHLTNYIYSFTETQLKFLLSNIVLGLQYIHSKGILHRDLKPENIIFDDKGYAYITDFGIAWSNDEDHEGDNSGTPGYMAPETLFGLMQDYCVDFYSLGVIGYEVIMGKTPYEGNSRHSIKKQMHEKNIYIDYDEAKNFSDICIDFINGLLVKNPGKRLGAESGISQIKDDIFFRGMNWELIYQHKYLSPILDIINFSKTREGGVEELFDVEYCKKKESIPQSTLERYEKIRNGRYFSKYFRNYSIICVDNILRELPKKKKVQVIQRVPVNGENNMNYYNNVKSNDQLYNNMNNKYLRRSKSIANDIVYPDINRINNYQRIEQRKINDIHNDRKIYKNLSLSMIKNNKKAEALKLPYIKNQLLKRGQEREKKIKKFYQNKLVKYNKAFKKLHLNYLHKAKELNKQNRDVKDMKYNLLVQKYLDLKNKKPVRIIENPPNYNNNNMNKNNYNGFIPNNNYNQCNCNLQCNCTNLNHCNCNCSCTCSGLNKFNYKDFYKKMNKNRDNFFVKYNNYSYNSDDEDSEECRCLYDQNLLECGNRVKICRCGDRYITIGRECPCGCVEVEASSTDEEEEEIEVEIEDEEPPRQIICIRYIRKMCNCNRIK